MAYIISSNYIINEYPEVCVDCPFLIRRKHVDNAYEGICYGCMLGYMIHGDTREYDVIHRRWKDCRIMGDSRVSLM